MKKRIILLTILIISVSATASFAGGWTQPKGGGFAKIDAYIINAGNVFDDDGESVSIPDYSFLSTNLYAEYGITDKLSGIIYFPFLVSSESDPFAGEESISISSVGDLDIGVRYGLLQTERVVVSGVLMLGIPTGSAEEEELLWTGDGEFNQIIKAEAGFSLPASVYAVAGLGFNNRSQGFSDEVIFDIEAGIGLFDQQLFFALKSAGKLPMDNGDEDVTGGYGMFSNNTGYVSFGPELTYIMKNGLGFSVNTYGAFFGRNLLAAPSYSAGIVYRMTP
jgi:hypothetical protein